MYEFGREMQKLPDLEGPRQFFCVWVYWSFCEGHIAPPFELKRRSLPHEIGGHPLGSGEGVFGPLDSVRSLEGEINSRAVIQSLVPSRRRRKINKAALHRGSRFRIGIGAGRGH